MVAIARVPDSVITVLGEQAGRDLTTWLEATMADGTIGIDDWRRAEARFDDIDAAHASTTQRLEAIESRMDGLESRMEGLETRMGALEARMAAVEARLDEFGSQLSEIRSDMREMRSTVATQLTMVLDDLHQATAGLRRGQEEMGQRVDVVQDRITDSYRAIVMQGRWNLALTTVFASLVTLLLVVDRLVP